MEDMQGEKKNIYLFNNNAENYVFQHWVEKWLNMG